MSFAGVILFELGYDGETVRQHEFEGKEAVFDDIVAAPAEVERLRAEVDEKQIQLNRWILHDMEKQREVKRLRAAHECCWHDGHGHGALGPCAVTEREARAALAEAKGSENVAP